MTIIGWLTSKNFRKGDEIMENDENRNENVDLEENDLDTMIAENMSSMYAAVQGMAIGSAEWQVVQEEMRKWYESYSKVHIESAKVVSEDTQKTLDREVEKERLKAKGKEVLLQLALGLIPTVISTVGTVSLANMFKDQQNRILAAEYIDDKFVMNKSFQMDYDALKSMISKRNI